MRRRRSYAFRPFVVTGVTVRGGRDERPRARSGHRVVCCTKGLYSLGGYNPNGQPADESWSPTRPVFRELWAYNFGRARWTRLPAHQYLPDQLASSAACRAGNLLMVFGGTGAPFGQQCSNSLYVYDITGKNGNFRLISTKGQPPLPQYGQAIMCIQGYLYVVGGTDGLLYTIDIHRLDLRTMTWETVSTCTGNRTDEPEARYRHELAFDGSNLYVLAGGTADRAFNFIDIPVFNIDTHTWSFKTSKFELGKGYPRARKCHSTVQIDREDGVDVFVMGGFDNTTIFDDLWRLEIPSLQWTRMRKSSFPYPLYFHSSAITPEGCMYTFGGIQLGRDGNTTSRSNKIFKVWLRIPKLSEMCWESIMYYFPHLANVEHSKLLKCGIPMHFVERLDVDS